MTDTRPPDQNAPDQKSGHPNAPDQKSGHPHQQAGAYSPVSAGRLRDAITRFGAEAKASTALPADTRVPAWKAGHTSRQSWPAKILISDYAVRPNSQLANGQNLGQVTQAQALILLPEQAVLDSSSDIASHAVDWQIISYLLLARTGRQAIYQLTIIRRPTIS